jgi:hypothetical protein
LVSKAAAAAAAAAVAAVASAATSTAPTLVTTDGAGEADIGAADGRGAFNTEMFLLLKCLV